MSLRAWFWMILIGMTAWRASTAEKEVAIHLPASIWDSHKLSTHKAGDFVEFINPMTGETTREEVLSTEKKNTLVRRVTVKPKDKDASVEVVEAVYDLPNEAGELVETKPMSVEVEFIEVNGLKLKTEKQKFSGENFEFIIWTCAEVPLGGTVKRMIGKNVVQLLTNFGQAKE